MWTGPSVLYHLKCLFSVLSCSSWRLSWGRGGKTSWVIIITRGRKGGQQQQLISSISQPLSPPGLNSFAPPLSSRAHSLMSHVRGWHLPFYRLLPTGPTLCQMNSKQAQLQLMGWIGSLQNIRSACKQHTFSWGLMLLEMLSALRTLSWCLDGWKTRQQLDERACCVEEVKV